MTRPRHLGGEDVESAPGGLDPTPTGHTTSPSGVSTANNPIKSRPQPPPNAKHGAKRKARHEDEALKRTLAQFAPPEAEDAPNSGADDGDEGAAAGGDAPADAGAPAAGADG